MRLLASVLVLLAGCSSCIDSLDPIACCEKKSRTSLQCEGSWIFEQGQCIFVCDDSCPTDILTCPDGTRLSRDPATCSFAECKSLCASATDKDLCCRKEKSGSQVSCHGTWRYLGDECVHSCYSDILPACSGKSPCKLGKCVFLGADSFCAEDPCSFFDCPGDCVLVGSYPYQVKCSSPCKRPGAECCSKSLECKKPLVVAYDAEACVCKSVSCLDYCPKEEFVVFDVDIGRCVCQPIPEKVRLGEPVSVRFGESVAFKTVDAVVSVLGVIEDSRCPSSVECIWQGRLSLLLSVERNGTVAPVVLSTGTGVSLEGFDLLIYDVSPPAGNSTIPWEEYTFKLLARKS